MSVKGGHGCEFGFVRANPVIRDSRIFFALRNFQSNHHEV